ncbi:unnamed protein product [Sphenostylis stenocarpa]|uniref:Uncharacterized protein n=1 Tax=Sphenostylis stenocarpa TaxID=92480 RepID=A0AA86W6A7_9FABA|nr:unnamed protein product [Sphenostylis stenocarpa]
MDMNDLKGKRQCSSNCGNLCPPATPKYHSPVCSLSQAVLMIQGYGQQVAGHNWATCWIRSKRIVLLHDLMC